MKKKARIISKRKKPVETWEMFKSEVYRRLSLYTNDIDFDEEKFIEWTTKRKETIKSIIDWLIDKHDLHDFGAPEPYYGAY